MKNFAAALCLQCLFISSLFANYGTDSRLVTLSFDSIEILIPIDTSISEDTSAVDVYHKLGESFVEEKIGNQLKYLLAAFSLHPKPLNYAQTSGTVALRAAPVVDLSTLKFVTRFGAHYLSLNYAYSDEGIFHKSIFKKNKEQTEIEVRLPLYADESLYQIGFVSIDDALKLYKSSTDGSLEEIQHKKEAEETTINLCTDLHYNDFGDYWYFWNPYSLGCPLSVKARSKVFKATLTAAPELADQLPDYKNFLKDNVLDITYLVGVDANFRNGDYGRETFRKAEQLLIHGRESLTHPTVKKKLTEGEIALLTMLPENEDLKFVYEENDPYDKTLVLQRLGYQVRVRMLLVDPGSEDPAKWEKFQSAATSGLMESDVFIYDGHSGLGGYLDPEILFSSNQKLKKNKSQIYFFNGCTTFPYYSQTFFDLKATPSDPQGRKNLDIVTTALGATFTLGAGQDVGLIMSLALQSGDWSEIMDRLHSVYPDESALTYVVTE